MSKRRHFAGIYSSEKGDKAMSNETTPDVRFLELIKARHYQDAIAMMAEVKDINVRDSESGSGAIHIAARRRCTILLKALWTRDDLNELLQDAKGSYASELAWMDGDDEELSAKLMEREHDYAKKHGLVAWPKPSTGTELLPG